MFAGPDEVIRWKSAAAPRGLDPSQIGKSRPGECLDREQQLSTHRRTVEGGGREVEGGGRRAQGAGRRAESGRRKAEGGGLSALDQHDLRFSRCWSNLAAGHRTRSCARSPSCLIRPARMQWPKSILNTALARRLAWAHERARRSRGDRELSLCTDLPALPTGSFQRRVSCEPLANSPSTWTSPVERSNHA